MRAKALGHKLLGQIDTRVTADMLLRWHRQLVAQKWNLVNRRAAGRPRIKEQIAALILRMAQENPSCGYTRILGALPKLGHQISRGTNATVLQENEMDPAPLRDKRTTGPTFLKTHWNILVFYSPLPSPRREGGVLTSLVLKSGV